MSYLFILDAIFSLYIFTRLSWKGLVPYMALSIYFYDTSPIDFFIFHLAIWGIFAFRYSLLAVLVKIPWITLPIATPVFFPFPPGYVWSFLLNNPYGLHEPGGLFRYSLLVGTWLTGILLNTYRRRRGHVQESMWTQDS